MRKRVSRSLWDKARNPNTPNRLLAIFKAILYELQPVDIMHFSGEGFQIDKALKWLKTTSQYVIVQVKDMGPTVVRFIRDMPLRHWMIPSVLLIYWKLIVYLHKQFDAGPFVLIITVLVIIFTVGLGDSTIANDGQERISAYSVFNRGFRSILGGVDANVLLNQHVGGGFLAGDDVPRDVNDALAADDVIVDDVRHRPRPIVRQQQQPQQLQPQPQPDGNIEKSRKSNKKNRRKKNIELRREMQRQREAAMAMGFVVGGVRGGGGDGGEDEWQNHRDQMAMNRLVEDEIRQAAAMQQHE